MRPTICSTDCKRAAKLNCFLQLETRKCAGGGDEYFSRSLNSWPEHQEGIHPALHRDHDTQSGTSFDKMLQVLLKQRETFCKTFNTTNLIYLGGGLKFRFKVIKPNQGNI